MRRAALLLVLLCPCVLSAQVSKPGASSVQSPAASAQVKLLTTGDDNSSVQPGIAATGSGATSDSDSVASQQNAKPNPATTTPVSTSTPKIPGSMVGYIDDPIVGSQVRIRYDAGFDDEFPDRAEYFYAKCACYRGLQTAIPPAFDPNAPGPGPGVPTAINFQELHMLAEYSPMRRFSAFVDVPIRWLQPQGFQPIPPFPAFPDQSGLGDVTAGLKFAAIATDHTYVTFQLKSYFPSGDATKGLGTNHYSVEPSILLYHSFTSKFVLEGQVGGWLPISGSAGVPITGSEGFAGNIFLYGIGPSYKLYSGRHFSLTPVIELFGWHVTGGFQTQPVTGNTFGAASEVDGLNIVNIKAGVRTSFGPHNSIYIGFGQAVTHDDWYKHIIRAEYRYTF
jgi:Putative MetA-pathway of phenol degradation